MVNRNYVNDVLGGYKMRAGVNVPPPLAKDRE